mmetsp:Transcript_20925/g.43670  ORF Transcript_20925/g.43670 Transcript_20925/m.43670 type:complete len:1240 (-) Transcript_20925:31-3750(-)
MESARDSLGPDVDLEEGLTSSDRAEALASVRHQQNVQQFAEAFEIQTEIDKLEWFRSVKIDPWTCKFTKDGKIAEDMEKTYWDQEAKYHRPNMVHLTSFWMYFNAFVLFCDIHSMYITTDDIPRIIKTRKFSEAYPVVLALRITVFVILIVAKLSKFFIGPDCGFLRSKWKVMIGMVTIQLIEMGISIYTVDMDPGMHCIVMLIMFNFTPQRLVDKAPLCIISYIIWVATFFWHAAILETNDGYKQLWGFGTTEENFFSGMKCTICYKLINVLTTTGMFMVVQIYVVFLREESLSQNLLAIKIGEVQSTIISKRNKTNEMLLNSMLPQEITKELPLSGDSNLTYVESYTDVTVLFCMIDNFGEISSTFDAIELVSILNGVYSVFDDLADNFGSIYKVETVGEVYMMAGGCPRRAVTHATDAAEMALAMLNVMPRIQMQIKDTIFGKGANSDRVENGQKKLDILDNLSIKVGLNTGQVTAGVIGATCQRFKLFGDTVNTASRMESFSLPNKIQVSDTTFKQLIKAKNFLFKKREKINVKGKGMVQTYFLQGKQIDSNKVEHDSLQTLVTREDQIKFNFVDVCKQAIKESQEKDGGHGEMDAFSKALQDESILEGLDLDDYTYSEQEGITSGATVNVADESDQLDEANQTAHYSVMFERLQKRAKPQLPMNQTLLFLFGYDLNFIKPSVVEAMLETHFRLNIFHKQLKKVRTITTFFFVMFIALLVYDHFVNNHKNDILLLRYVVSIPILVIFIAFTYHSNFFYFQQTSMSLVCLALGISIVLFETFQAPNPGYGILLILFIVVFQFESLFFLNRTIIVLFLTIMYAISLNMFCVNYNNRCSEEDCAQQDETALVHALTLNLSEVANTFCDTQISGLTETDDLIYGEFYQYEIDNLETTVGLDVLKPATKKVLWGALEKRQTVAPFPALQQIIIILCFLILLIIPSWVSNYFSRVCYNRVQREYEMEKEGKLAQTRTREFLERLVPASIVPKLSHGKFIADRLDDISILFVDMVGFTKFSSQLDPDELVMFLNEMYSNFDEVLERYCLYKVEIIGDALFAVAGAPEDRYDKYHAARCVCAANGLLKEVIKLRDFLEISIRIRIGVHTGSCVAGVVGIKDPRYHLFGVTSNNAEKMESTGAAGRVHVSKATMDSILEAEASQGIKFIRRDTKDLPDLPETASEEKKAKRQQTINNIEEAKSKVGTSYFAEVDEEQVMTFPNLLEARKGTRRSTKKDKERRTK